MRVIAAATAWGLNGVSVFYAHLVRELRQRGHDAEIIITCPDHQIPPSLPMPADLPVHSLPVSRPSDSRSRWLALSRWIQDREPCVYLPDFDGLAPVAELGAGVRVVGIVHNDCPAHYAKLWPAMAQWDAVVAVGDRIAQTIRQEHPEYAVRLSTIPHGIPAPALPVTKPGDGPLHVVYAGRLEQEQKRVLDVLAAVAAARRLGADIALTVAGDGSHRAVMEALAQRLKLAAEFTGVLDNPEAMALFARSQIVLLTSDYEGFAIALLEGMSVGCVPVASRIEGGFRALVRDGETGLLVEPRDVHGFARALFRLDRDREYLARLAARATAAARDRRYSVVQMTDRYIDVFERALACKSVRSCTPVRI